MAYEKHVGIYHTKEELTADLNKLKSPWVAYVGPNENGGFDFSYWKRAKRYDCSPA